MSNISLSVSGGSTDAVVSSSKGLPEYFVRVRGGGEVTENISKQRAIPVFVSGGDDGDTDISKNITQSVSESGGGTDNITPTKERSISIGNVASGGFAQEDESWAIVTGVERGLIEIQAGMLNDTMTKFPHGDVPPKGSSERPAGGSYTVSHRYISLSVSGNSEKLSEPVADIGDWYIRAPVRISVSAGDGSTFRKYTNYTVSAAGKVGIGGGGDVTISLPGRTRHVSIHASTGGNEQQPTLQTAKSITSVSVSGDTRQTGEYRNYTVNRPISSIDISAGGEVNMPLKFVIVAGGDISVSYIKDIDVGIDFSTGGDVEFDHNRDHEVLSFFRIGGDASVSYSATRIVELDVSAGELTPNNVSTKDYRPTFEKLDIGGDVSVNVGNKNTKLSLNVSAGDNEYITPSRQSHTSVNITARAYLRLFTPRDISAGGDVSVGVTAQRYVNLLTSIKAGDSESDITFGAKARNLDIDVSGSGEPEINLGRRHKIRVSGNTCPMRSRLSIKDRIRQYVLSGGGEPEISFKKAQNASVSVSAGGMSESISAKYSPDENVFITANGDATVSVNKGTNISSVDISSNDASERIEILSRRFWRQLVPDGANGDVTIKYRGFGHHLITISGGGNETKPLLRNRVLRLNVSAGDSENMSYHADKSILVNVSGNGGVLTRYPVKVSGGGSQSVSVAPNKHSYCADRLTAYGDADITVGRRISVSVNAGDSGSQVIGVKHQLFITGGGDVETQIGKRIAIESVEAGGDTNIVIGRKLSVSESANGETTVSAVRGVSRNASLSIGGDIVISVGDKEPLVDVNITASGDTSITVTKATVTQVTITGGYEAGDDELSLRDVKLSISESSGGEIQIGNIKAGTNYYQKIKVTGFIDNPIKRKVYI